jgi:hypothetical protein
LMPIALWPNHLDLGRLNPMSVQIGRPYQQH